MTTVDEVRAALGETDLQVHDQKPIDHGMQLHLSNGVKVNVFNSGTLQVQGKRQQKEETERLLGEHLGTVVGAAPSKRVFVVYGRDEGAKAEVEAMLRRWDLEPVFLDQIAPEGKTLIEKLESYMADTKFAVVIATADDIAIADDETQEYRARQNVVLELGMMLAKLGRPAVAILLENKVGMKKPSDIEGLEYIPVTDSVKESGVTLGKMMSNRGYTIDIKKL
jgi:predicted nucleotide-binding protein